MNLTEDQKKTVARWIHEGLKLSEIQTRLDSELKIRMTYMEVKLLMADLELKPKDQERPKAPAELAAATPAGPAASSAPGNSPSALVGSPQDHPLQDPAAQEASTPGASQVQVTVDTVTRPGSVVSGKVTFSDGKSADWFLDQMGRLGLAAAEKGYKPSQADVMAFQEELQAQLARYGF